MKIIKHELQRSVLFTCCRYTHLMQLYTIQEIFMPNSLHVTLTCQCMLGLISSFDQNQEEPCNIHDDAILHDDVVSIMLNMNTTLTILNTQLQQHLIVSFILFIGWVKDYNLITCQADQVNVISFLPLGGQWLSLLV